MAWKARWERGMDGWMWNGVLKYDIKEKCKSIKEVETTLRTKGIINSINIFLLILTSSFPTEEVNDPSLVKAEGVWR